MIRLFLGCGFCLIAIAIAYKTYLDVRQLRITSPNNTEGVKKNG